MSQRRRAGGGYGSFLLTHQLRGCFAGSRLPLSESSDGAAFALVSRFACRRLGRPKRHVDCPFPQSWWDWLDLSMQLGDNVLVPMLLVVVRQRVLMEWNWLLP
jgi:hypothetical protein